MKKKLLSILLTALMLFMLLPINTNKAEAEEYTPNYLTFTAEQANSTVTFGYLVADAVEFCTILSGQNSGWKTYTANTQIELPSIGDQVSFRGIGVITNNASPSFCFQMSGSIKASGSVTSLTDGNGGNPNVQLSVECYCGMFFGCESLTTAPELPAMRLQESCYESMFVGCTSLTATPELPSLSLAKKCYRNMFFGCTSLTCIPELPASNLPESCYERMFHKCTSLKINSDNTNGGKEWSSPNTADNPGNYWNKDMFAETTGKLTGNPDLNTTYYIASALSSEIKKDPDCLVATLDKVGKWHLKEDSKAYETDKLMLIGKYDEYVCDASVYKTGDENTSVNLIDNKFLMPIYPITVKATVKKVPISEITNNTVDFNVKFENEFYKDLIDIYNLVNALKFPWGNKYIYVYDKRANLLDGTSSLNISYISQDSYDEKNPQRIEFKQRADLIDNALSKNGATYYILGTTTEASITLTPDNSNTDVVYGVGGTLKYNIETENLPTISEQYVFKVFDSNGIEQTTFSSSLNNNVVSITVPASAAFDTYTIKTSKGRFTGEDVSFTLAKKELTATTVVEDKCYDGTTKAYVTASNLSGIVNNDTVLIDTVSGTYDSKEVETNKDVTVKYTLTGTDADKYFINDKVVKAAIKDIDPGESSNIKGASVDPTNIKNVFKTFITYNEGQVDHSTKYPKPTKFAVKVDNNPSGDSYDNDIKEILKEAKGKKYQGYKSSVELTYGEGQTPSTEEIKDTKGLIKIIYDFNYNDRKDIQLFRVHNGVVEELTKTPNSEGEYIEFDKANNKLIVWAKFYSTYAITYNKIANQPYKVVNTGVEAINTNTLKLIGLISLLGIATAIAAKKKKH